MTEQEHTSFEKKLAVNPGESRFNAAIREVSQQLTEEASRIQKYAQIEKPVGYREPFTGIENVFKEDGVQLRAKMAPGTERINYEKNKDPIPYVQSLIRFDDAFTRVGKKFSLRYRYDHESKRVHLRTPTVIIEKLSARSTRDIRDSLIHRQMIENAVTSLEAHNISINPRAIVNRWEKQFGLKSGYREEIFHLIPAFNHLSTEGESAVRTVQSYLSDYLPRISMLRRQNDSLKSTAINWNIAAAIAAKNGSVTRDEMLTVYARKEDAKHNDQTKTKKILEKLDSTQGDSYIPLLYPRNSALVGRIVLYGYVRSRADELQEIAPAAPPDAVLKRSIAEAIVMAALVVPPEHKIMKTIKLMSDDVLYQVVADIQTPHL